MTTLDRNERLGNVHLPIEDDAPHRLKHAVIGTACVRHLRPGGRVLDIGCGMGQISEIIHKADPDTEIHLADAYRACLDHSAKRVRGAITHLIDEESFDIAALPNDHFDLVVMSHVLEHLRDPVRAMQQVMDKVAPGGVAVIAVPNAIRPDLILLSMLRRHYVNRGHVCAWDMSTWMNFLERILGLDVIEYPHSFLRFPGHNSVLMKPLSLALGHLFPHWCNENIAVIRKSGNRSRPDHGR